MHAISLHEIDLVDRAAPAMREAKILHRLRPELN